ncbi:MAG: helix-hairpin-helix domain-containing protein [Fulvivirga sp.]|nr:helix-hairpin-helix domain-containing protein [Fulvivirga sp.]
MKKLNAWLRNYFGFSKTEVNGTFVLIFLVLASILLYYFVRHHEPQTINKADIQQADSLSQLLAQSISVGKESDPKEKKVKKKGKNETDRRAFKHRSQSASIATKSNSSAKNKQKIAPFDINTADTVTLKKIYGIGPVLSSRIVKYRSILGGFIHKDQLDEVYGLRDEALHNLKAACYISKKFVPKQLPVNELKSYILDDHPYISKKVARAIDNYRFQHGEIGDEEMLYKIHPLDSSTIRKIAPYLKF